MNEINQQKIISSIEFMAGKRNLRLVPAHPLHAEQVVEAVIESEVPFKKFFPWAHFAHATQISSQIERLAKAYCSFFLFEEFIFHLFEGDHLLGAFGLHPRTLNQRGLELGYWVRASATGQGLATLASQHLVVYAFEVLEIERLQCGYNERNDASRRVNEKLGFIKEGVLSYFEGMAPGGSMGPGFVIGRLLKPEALALPWYATCKQSGKIQRFKKG